MIENKNEGKGVGGWIPCITMGVAAFIFNTTEFVPIALLSDIASDLSVSEAKAGLLVTIYAWVVALASLPLILIVGRIERKKLMICLLVVFTISNLLSWQSGSYTTLLISRLIIACTHAIFWSVAVPMAVALAPKGRSSTGLSIVATGTALATVLGLPFGRTIGLYMGWRTTFLFLGIGAFLVLLLVIFILPVMKSENSGSLRSLPVLFRRPALVGIYILTVLIVTAYFTGYTYIEPFMIHVAMLGENLATAGLLIFGLAGIIGSVVFARYNDKFPLKLMGSSIIFIAISLFMMYPAAVSIYTMFGVCALWGISAMIFSLSFQDKIIKIASDASAVAMSIFSGIFNIGIGTGALLGGIVSTHAGLKYIGFAGFIINLIAVVVYFGFRGRFKSVR